MPAKKTTTAKKTYTGKPVHRSGVLSQNQRHEALEVMGILPAYHAYRVKRMRERLDAGESSTGTTPGARGAGGAGGGGAAQGGSFKDANAMFDPLIKKFLGGVLSSGVTGEGGKFTALKAVPMEPGEEAKTVRWVGDNMVVTNPDLSAAPSTTAIWLLSVARDSPPEFLRVWMELLKFQRRQEAAAKFVGDHGRTLGLLEDLLVQAEGTDETGEGQEAA